MNPAKDEMRREPGNPESGQNYQTVYPHPGMAPGMGFMAPFQNPGYPVVYVPMMLMPMGVPMDMYRQPHRMCFPTMAGIRANQSYFFPPVQQPVAPPSQLPPQNSQPRDHGQQPAPAARVPTTLNFEVPQMAEARSSSVNDNRVPKKSVEDFDDEFNSESEEVFVEESLFGCSEGQQENDPQTDPEKIADPLALQEEKFARLVV